MTSNNKKELLLEMKNIHIDGFSDERWHKILKGVDLNLYRGEILGLIDTLYLVFAGANVAAKRMTPKNEKKEDWKNKKGRWRTND